MRCFVAFNHIIVCVRKIQYDTYQQAKNAVSDLPQKPYKCRICRKFHTATIKSVARAQKREQTIDIHNLLRKYSEYYIAERARSQRNVENRSIYLCNLCASYHIQGVNK